SVKPGSRSSATPARPAGRHSRACRVLLARAELDIPVLAEFFLREQNHNSVSIAPAALDELRSFPWPGNVRGLRNAVIRAAIMRSGNEIQPEDLPLGSRRSRFNRAPSLQVSTRWNV